tara:strand:+ start:1214 stop:1660 length:447 start_codon:yes stop_codon:yes gene_type:complete
MQIIASNKKGNFNYNIIEKYETGIVLTGPEVKSLRVNTASIKESYILEKKGELWLTNCHIKKYSSSSSNDDNQYRQRKILVKKKELNKILGFLKKDRLSIVPLLMYFNNKGIAKLSIGLGKGKKLHDKRAGIKEKEWNIKKNRLEKNK